MLNARAAAGDQRAFSQLVLRHERRLRAFLARSAGSTLADDLAQETFLRAWRRARQFDSRGNYAAWLYRIGWRLFLDDRRRRGLDKRTWAGVVLLADKVGLEPDHPMCMDVRDAIDRLAPLERAALQLCEGEGWTHAEAAHILQTPLGTLKSIVSRAKRNLRASLDTGALSHERRDGR